jgi:hypothetical protein
MIYCFIVQIAQNVEKNLYKGIILCFKCFYLTKNHSTLAIV